MKCIWPASTAHDMLAPVKLWRVSACAANQKYRETAIGSRMCRRKRMKLGVFYEHQLPQPWEEGSERKLFNDALDQIELADRLGFDHMWEVEHHFLEEYSHSSAPEVFLGAVSQRTKNIRLGHGICLSSPNYNHPARVAERLATLD